MAMKPATPCVFCRILQEELTPEVVAFRDNMTAAFPSRLQQPRNLGHMLVMPIRHVEQIYDLEAELAGPMMIILARVGAAVKRAYAADGISIRQNNEPAAGQDVFHVHFHVIPSFTDDGFTALDRSLGAIEVPLEERIAQAKQVSEALRHLNEATG
jgi:histidine triad (HIT) family protein